jgi:nickel-dependent lactate racemase
MTYIGSDNIEELLAEASLMTDTTSDPLALPVAATVARVRQRIMLALVSEGISYKDAFRAGFQKYDTIECALEDAFAQHGSSAKVSVLPYGALVYPILPEDNYR